MTNDQETTSWPEFFARAKKVGTVSYTKKIQTSPVSKPGGKVAMEQLETGHYVVRDEDDQGQRKLFYTTTGDSSKLLTQLTIAGIKIGDKAGATNETRDDRIATLEDRVASLEAQVQQLTNPPKRVAQRKKK